MIDLTRTGQTSYVYEQDRILAIDHREEPFSQKATVILNNADGALSALDLKGYKGVISYGFNTSAGGESSSCAPLYVIPQELKSSPDQLDMILSLKGIPDLLDDDKASSIYIPLLTDTVKTLINGILGATFSCYSHCTAYTVNWDSEDSIIDSYLPKQNFRTLEGKSRLACLYELLQYTKCVCLWKADGQAHIIVPKISGETWVKATAYEVNDYVQPSTVNNNFTYKCTTAGTSHASTEPTWPTTAGQTVTDGTCVWTAVAPDYEYRDNVASYHTFFSKVHRSRLVIPNYVTVTSFVGDVPSYTGYATDASYSNIRKDAFLRARLASNAQGTAIAKAVIAQVRLSQESGAGSVPINVGAEVFDYNKIVDSSQGDTRLGNVGYVHRKVRPENASPWEMSFGFGGWLSRQSFSKDLINTALGWQVGEGALTNIALNIVTDVGDTLLHSNDTQTDWYATATWKKYKEILIPCYGYLRVKFDWAAIGDEGDMIYSRIYKNGAAFGTLRSSSGGIGTFGTVSEDLSGFKPGDLLQVYLKGGAAGGQAGAKNFRLYWDSTGQVNPYTPLFVNTMTNG